jgi:hypothetical protein
MDIFANLYISFESQSPTAFRPAIHHKAHWWMGTVLAEELRVGRVFLLSETLRTEPSNHRWEASPHHFPLIT